MIRKINNTRGQTALILILLTAAALILLAVTLNWGRIAQVKSVLTISSDVSASTLASDAASYGEMEKQTYLGNSNYSWRIGGVVLGIILLIAAIVLLYFCPPAGAFMLALAIATFAMLIIDIVLQYTVVGPGMQALWNSAQKKQPVQQQFYEQGISTALGSAVMDQVNITDYFDWNANGAFGNNASRLPNDIISRFGVFYSDRLKMLNQPPIPQVVFFYNQLGELMNGETCTQNAIDNCLNSSIPLNPQCPSDCAVSNPYATKNSCTATSSDPVCQLKIPNGFQLNDACVDSNPSSPTYNPYCDPCCQPAGMLNPMYCSPNNSSSSTTTSTSSTTCTGLLPDGTTSCNCDPLVPQYISMRPSNCDQSASPAQCLKNNPYGSTTANPYTLLYDPAYQEYSNGLSFLDQFGRDQQMGPFTTSLTPQGLFPNGIYSFFWLMKDYSPEVDNIVSTNLQSSQSHWCAAATAPGYTAPAGYSDLVQLSLPYACSGQDCCVNGLANSVTSGIPTITTSATPGATNWVIDAVSSSSIASNAPNPAIDPSFADPNAGTWLEGDNQFCSSAPPYNASTSGIPDGTCEWTGTTTAPTTTTVPPNVNNSDITSGITVDALDDTMHTLSDFVNFANTFLGQNIEALSASFATWYPQVAVWISPVCDDGSTCSVAGQCGDGTMCGRLLPLAQKLNAWNTATTTWLKNDYSNANAWCVPSTTTGFANEDRAITNNGTAAWGSLPSVINCLNYNAITPINNYQQCQQWLRSPSCSSASSLTGTPCDPVTLGRSLEPQPTTAIWSAASCGTTAHPATTPYAIWVNDNLTLATDEAPKFVLRSAFLTDIQTRAKTMQNIFKQGGQELQSFLSGPAAQLISASQTQPTATLPNSVIYGWIDKKLPNGQQGYAHIVKVTAYAPGRGGNYAITGFGSSPGLFIWSQLPWIKMTKHAFTYDYELRSRDGYVYVSVKRWDEDHSNSLRFPNGHQLWQFMFHNPTIATNGSNIPQIGGGSLGPCAGLNSGTIGFGLEPQTVAGLTAPSLASISPKDLTALGQAFMLNDEGTGPYAGQVDPNAMPKSSTSGAYLSCLQAANQLLANAPESHACAEYIGTSPSSNPQGVINGASGKNDADYSLKFVDCSTVPGIPGDLSSLDDLSYGE